MKARRAAQKTQDEQEEQQTLSEELDNGQDFNTEEGTEPGVSGSEGGGEDGSPGPAKKRKKVLSEERIKRLKEDYDKRGIIYVSRIPPHMKPMKLKQLLSQYGETLRVYCAPEDPKLRRMRKQKGGSSGKNFTEGWVEFADKRVAKRTALMLNGQRIGGKRRSAYYDDLWVCKYLKHFKWDHLTEEIAYQKAIREQRLAAEISAAKRERDHYLAQVDRAKALAAMDERRAAKASAPDTPAAAAAAPTADKRKAPAAAGSGGAIDSEAGRKRKMNSDIGQRVPRADPASGGTTGREMADDVLMMVARNKKAKKL